jgi:hypothetical protein
MSASEVLQAAAEDLRFSSLKTLSELIAVPDQACADDDAGASEAAVASARDPLGRHATRMGFRRRTSSASGCS